MYYYENEADKETKKRETLKVIKRHGFIALILFGVLILLYMSLASVSGGLDSLGAAIVLAVLFRVTKIAFGLNLVLGAIGVAKARSSAEVRTRISLAMVVIYAAALVCIIYEAFSFSYGKFLLYLAQGEFFAWIYLLMMAVLVVLMLHELFVIRRKRSTGERF